MKNKSSQSTCLGSDRRNEVEYYCRESTPPEAQGFGENQARIEGIYKYFKSVHRCSLPVAARTRPLASVSVMKILMISTSEMILSSVAILRVQRASLFPER